MVLNECLSLSCHSFPWQQSIFHSISSSFSSWLSLSFFSFLFCWPTTTSLPWWWKRWSGLDRCSDSDILFFGSRLRNSLGPFQLQQIPQQLLQARVFLLFSSDHQFINDILSSPSILYLFLGPTRNDLEMEFKWFLMTLTFSHIPSSLFITVWHTTHRDAIFTSTVNCLTSFIAGFVIFSVLGYMAHVLKKDVANVAADGPGLVFVVYPEALAAMSGASFWSILFFIMLITLGLDSTFGGLEAMITGLCDEYPKVIRKNREVFVGLLLIFIMICSLPTTTYVSTCFCYTL